jgi:Na+/melibiose symporter-like transporter
MLGNPEGMGLLQTAEKIPWIIGVIILAPFIKKFGKRNMVLACAVLCVASMGLVLIAPTSYPMLLVAAVMRGFGEAPFYGCIFTMLADVIEYGHWKTGLRVHALVFSAFTVGQKLGGGLAAWIIGHLMEAGFELQYLLGNPQVYDYSRTIDVFVMEYGISNGKFGRAIAAGMFKSVVAIFLLFGANFIAKKLDEDTLI